MMCNKMDIGYDQKGNTRLYLGENPEQILVVSNSGYGKSLAVESLAERYQEDGWTVIYLGDGGKGKEEIFFSNFLPIEKYHLDFLNKIGKPIKALPCKAYHPFSFSLVANKKIAPYQIYTLGIKDCLERKALSMLVETQADSDVIRILQDAIANIPKTAGIYHLLHEIQSLIKPTKIGSGEIKPSDKNFYLKVGSANAKNMSEIASLFKPFLIDYFLAEQNCKYNLNWKEILNDNKSIHFFSTKYIKDPKMQNFVILSILNQVILHKDLAKKPILIVVPEARKVLGNEGSENYKKFLAQAMTENLSIMRSMGKGFASLLDTQCLSDLSSSVTASFTKTFLGRLAVMDIEKLSKIFPFIDRQVKEDLLNPEMRNTYYCLQFNSYGFFHLLFPSFRHAEVRYNIDDTFEQEKPELMQDYSELIKEMGDKLNREQSFFREKSEREIEAIKLREKRKSEDKKEANNKPALDEQKQKRDEEDLLSKMETAYRLRVVEHMTLEKSAEIMGVGKDSIVRWAKKHEERMKQSQPVSTPEEQEESIS